MAAPVRLRFLGSSWAVGTDPGVSTTPPGTITSFSMTVVNPATGVPTITNLVAVQVVGGSSAPTLAVTDSNGNSYTLDLAESSPSMSIGPGTTAYLYTAIFSAPGGTPLDPGDTITVTASSGNFWAGTIFAEEWANLLSSSPLDQTAADSLNSTASITSGATAATAVADEALFGVLGLTNFGSVATLTRGGSWSASVSGLKPLYSGPRIWVPQTFGSYQIVTGTGTYEHDGTLGAALAATEYASSLIATYSTGSPSAELVGVGVLSSTRSASASLVGVGVLSSSVSATASLVGVGVVTTTATATHTGSASLIGVGALRATKLYTLWSDLGKIIGRVRALGSLANTNLSSQLSLLVTGFQCLPALEGVYGTWEGVEEAFTGLRNAIAGFADVRLLNLDWVIRELGLTESAGLDDVFVALADRMLEDGITINRSTVTLGTVEPDQNNYGDGTVLVTKVLDGVTPPGSGFPSYPYYDGLNSELAVASETMTLECIADGEADGLTEGGESFRWWGGPQGSGLTWETEGSGDGPAVTGPADRSVLSNGDMESFTSNVPTSWDLDSGTAGTHVFQETSNQYRGDACLKLLGDGSTTIQLSQTLTDLMTPHRRYAITARVLATGPGSTGTLRLGFAGTGYTATSGEEISYTATNLPTVRTLATAWINAPEFMPDDWEFVIKATALDTNLAIYVDDVFVWEVDYHGGVGLVLVPGATPFVRGDKFSFTVDNDAGGVFQEFFRAHFGVQLRSASSPTVSDSLAAMGL